VGSNPAGGADEDTLRLSADGAESRAFSVNMGTLNYDIVATLGPSSKTRPVWEKMVSAGVNTFRLNTSHLSEPDLDLWLEELAPFLEVTGTKLVLDLQGSKWRLGYFRPFRLILNHKIELVLAEQSEWTDVLPVPHPDFFQAVLLLVEASSSQSEARGAIILNDAKATLRIEEAAIDRISARVIKGGVISPRKGITIKDVDYRCERLNGFDNYVFMAARNLPYSRFAISYLKDAQEMRVYRSSFGGSAYLIAKLERHASLADAHHIVRYADELWLCRGDLGAELGMKALAEQVKTFSESLGNLPVSVFLAGQVLEHMTRHSTPTRSEVCYLYDSLVRGYRGVVLSDETAIGRYPVESCKVAALFKQ
jgi:pyruvate kinase